MMQPNLSTNADALPTLKVLDLAQALEFFTQRLGFRLDMIVPADAPQAALLTGQGLSFRLEAHPPLIHSPSPNPRLTPEHGEFVISRCTKDGDWHAGRAGMQYRDLIADRLGGRVVASHIRIPEGGAVPDYVHYHKVSFQMIYCRAGWVRVVYEDQGEPLVMEAGDCILQPPQIRHRVLAASPGLEVIELGCPALHETWADYALTLPTPQYAPKRKFGGQRFVHHRARAAQWLPWRLAGFSARDTGIAAATQGLATVNVVKTLAPGVVTSEPHTDTFLFFFILAGALVIENFAPLQAGDSCVVPAATIYTLRAEADLEMLEVVVRRTTN